MQSSTLLYCYRETVSYTRVQQLKEAISSVYTVREGTDFYKALIGMQPYRQILDYDAVLIQHNFGMQRITLKSNPVMPSLSYSLDNPGGVARYVRELNYKKKIAILLYGDTEEISAAAKGLENIILISEEHEPLSQSVSEETEFVAKIVESLRS